MSPRFKAPLIASTVAAIVLWALSGLAQKKGSVPFPTGYRHWTHVKTMAIYGSQHPLFSQFGGLHNVYVNDLGLASLKQGKATPTARSSSSTCSIFAPRRVPSRQEVGSSSP